MDRFTRTADIIKSYYTYKRTSDAATFVKKVCSFFDFIKDEPISESDMNFLLFLANEAGIPQYYDLLKDKFTSCGISDENIKSLTLSALFHDASLITGDIKLHRYQKNVLDSFIHGQRNRFVLTAPTSFGFSSNKPAVRELCKIMQFECVWGLCNSLVKRRRIHSGRKKYFHFHTRKIFVFYGFSSATKF